MASGGQSNSRRRRRAALVLREGLKTAAVGLVLGMGGAAALVSILRALFYEEGPFDPVVMCAVAIVLFGVAFVANYVPARRATRVDPLRALHQE